MDDPGRVRSQEISVVQCVLRSTVCTAVDPGLHSDNNNTMIDLRCVYFHDSTTNPKFRTLEYALIF